MVQDPWLWQQRFRLIFHATDSGPALQIFPFDTPRGCISFIDKSQMMPPLRQTMQCGNTGSH